MKKNELKFQVEADTSVLQLKLRAIAKHATALADELDEIDQAKCPECGSADAEVTEETLYANGKQVFEMKKEIKCNSCSIVSDLKKDSKGTTNHINVNVASFVDIDMDKVAKELFNLQRSKARGR